MPPPIMPSTEGMGSMSVYFKRMICACCGGVLTSLVTTPLEVLKTRMQATPHPTLSASSAPAMSISLTATTLLRTEGVLSFWSGLKPSLIMQIPSTVLYFTLYDEVRGRLEARGQGDTLALLAPALSGTLSRSMVCTVLAPLELVRTRAMAANGEQGILRAIRAEVAKGGLGTLWRGLGPTLARDVPFSAIYWLGYEHIKSRVIGWGGHGNSSGGISSSSSSSSSSSTTNLGGHWATAFFSGVTAGSVAALVTTPQDVIKTRRQVSTYANAPMWSMGRQIVAAEGWRALFSGASMRCLRVGPACGIMIATYEMGKIVLGL